MKSRKSVEINGRQRAVVGRRHEAKALILLALGNDGQQRAPVKTGSNPHLPAISKPKPRSAIRFGALSFPGVCLCQPQMVERPRSNARRATKRELAHISATRLLAPVPSVLAHCSAFRLGNSLAVNGWIDFAVRYVSHGQKNSASTVTDGR